MPHGLRLNLEFVQDLDGCFYASVVRLGVLHTLALFDGQIELKNGERKEGRKEHVVPSCESSSRISSRCLDKEKKSEGGPRPGALPRLGAESPHEHLTLLTFRVAVLLLLLLLEEEEDDDDDEEEATFLLCFFFCLSASRCDSAFFCPLFKSCARIASFATTTGSALASTCLTVWHGRKRGAFEEEEEEEGEGEGAARGVLTGAQAGRQAVAPTR